MEKNIFSKKKLFFLIIVVILFIFLNSCFSLIESLIEKKIEQKINQKVTKSYVYNEVKFIINYNFFYGTIFYLDEYKEGFGTI